MQPPAPALSRQEGAAGDGRPPRPDVLSPGANPASSLPRPPRPPCLPPHPATQCPQTAGPETRSRRTPPSPPPPHPGMPWPRRRSWLDWRRDRGGSRETRPPVGSPGTDPTPSRCSARSPRSGSSWTSFAASSWRCWPWPPGWPSSWGITWRGGHRRRAPGDRGHRLLGGVAGPEGGGGAEPDATPVEPWCSGTAERMSVDARELVPGDVIVLEAGTSVPADARLLTATELRVVEAPLTGESVPVGKTADPVEAAGGQIPLADRISMVFKGTVTAAGAGTGVVVATGMPPRSASSASWSRRPRTRRPPWRNASTSWGGASSGSPWGGGGHRPPGGPPG
jgi:hypothetical protein